MPSVLITGTSSGIGEACVRRFERAGWDVIATVRPGKEDADYGWGASVRVMPLDMASSGSVQALVARVLAEGGAPDVLVNNAGIVVFGPLEDVGMDRIEQQFRVNAFAQLELTRAFLPAMRERRSGTIVFISSLGGVMVFPFYGVYHASKHALEGFGEGLWHELRPFGVRVKLIEPGYVDTPIYDTFKDAKTIDETQPAYRPYVKSIVEFTKAITSRTTPDDAAEVVFRVATQPGDRLRYPMAAYAAFLVRWRRLLGDMSVMRYVNRVWMGNR